jgi:hypothetical protein
VTTRAFAFARVVTVGKLGIEPRRPAARGLQPRPDPYGSTCPVVLVGSCAPPRRLLVGSCAPPRRRWRRASPGCTAGPVPSRWRATKGPTHVGALARGWGRGACGCCCTNGLPARNRTWTAAFVERCLEIHQDEEGKNRSPECRERVLASRAAGGTMPARRPAEWACRLTTIGRPQRKKEVSNPTPLPGCTLFSRQVRRLAGFSSNSRRRAPRGDAREGCSSRWPPPVSIRTLRVFRAALSPDQLEGHFVFVRCARRRREDERGRQRTRTSHGVAVRIAFQAISAPRGVTFHKPIRQNGRIRTSDLQSPRLALLPG